MELLTTVTSKNYSQSNDSNITRRSLGIYFFKTFSYVCMRPEYVGMKPNHAKRGPHRHSPRQNWLGNVMKRYFVHISLIGAKWIPKSFTPQQAFRNALTAPELRNQDLSLSTQDSSTALLTPVMPYSLHYNTHRQTAGIYLFSFRSSSCSRIT